jgi:SNF2 family DNA or RNA helicase
MEIQLLPHQIIGVSWLVRQERESGFKGGILADEMGLWVFSLPKPRWS